MKVIHLSLNVLGRFLISLFFLSGSVNKILHWRDSEQHLMNTLCDWQTQVGFSDRLSDCLVLMIPLTPVLLLVATFLEFVGSLLLLTGVKEKIGALFLIIFLIPITILMHPFWFVEGHLRELQVSLFLGNFAILGGLILFALKETDQPKSSFTKNMY